MRIRRRSIGDDVDQLPPLATGEPHGAVGEGEERVVTAPADVRARVELGAALTHDDRTGADGGPAELLDPEALSGRVPPVSGRASALGLGHADCSLFSFVGRSAPLSRSPEPLRRAVQAVIDVMAMVE